MDAAPHASVSAWYKYRDSENTQQNPSLLGDVPASTTSRLAPLGITTAVAKALGQYSTQHGFQAFRVHCETIDASLRCAAREGELYEHCSAALCQGAQGWPTASSIWASRSSESIAAL